MNFLHPIYTGYLFKPLQKQSLNIYGAEGQGRERLFALWLKRFAQRVV